MRRASRRSSSTRARSSICPPAERRDALKQLGDAARLAAKLQLGLGLAGGLGYRTLHRGDPGGARRRARGGRPRRAHARGAGRARPRAARSARAGRVSRNLRAASASERSHEAAWPLVTRAQMRALDRHTIETLGVPGEVLMESAGPRRGAGGARAASSPATPCAWSAGPATTAATAWSSRATCTRSACPCARRCSRSA